MKKAEIFISLFFMNFSIIIFKMSDSFPSLKGHDVGSGFFPRMLSIILIFLSLLLLFGCFKKKNSIFAENNEKSIDILPSIRVIIVIILTIAYRYLLEYVGLLILSPLYLIILMLLIKVEDFKKSVFLSIFVTITLWFIFCYLLKMPLPTGSIFQ